MSSTLSTKVVSYQLYDAATGWQGDDIVGHVFKAPAFAQGGGLTILNAYVVNAAATTSGTSFALQLENWGTAGTAVAGTIAAALGGTADPFAASVPKAFTISDSYVEFGEWVVLRKTETNSSDPTRCTLFIEYLLGE